MRSRQLLWMGRSGVGLEKVEAAEAKAPSWEVQGFT